MMRMKIMKIIIKRSADEWRLGASEMGKTTSIFDFLGLLTPVSHETWLPLVP